MNISHFIGIDVSKNTLDWAVYADQHIIWQTQSENSSTAIRAVIKQLRALPSFDCLTCVVCMEHTATADRGSLQCARVRGAFSGSIPPLVRSLTAY